MKGLCEFVNHTYIMFDPSQKFLISIEEQRISGVFGICLDKPMCQVSYKFFYFYNC